MVLKVEAAAWGKCERGEREGGGAQGKGGAADGLEGSSVRSSSGSPLHSALPDKGALGCGEAGGNRGVRWSRALAVAGVWWALGTPECVYG